MVPQKKLDQVSSLTAKFARAKTVVFTDYTGLNVGQITELRAKVKHVGGELEVTKNTYLKRAGVDAKINLEGQELNQPTATLWAFEDEIAPLKVLADFVKINNLPKIKSGLFQGTFVDTAKIKQLASLPSMTELRGQLVGMLASPMSRLVRGLNWNIVKFVFTIKAIADKKATA